MNFLRNTTFIFAFGMLMLLSYHTQRPDVCIGHTLFAGRNCK